MSLISTSLLPEGNSIFTSGFLTADIRRSDKEMHFDYEIKLRVSYIDNLLFFEILFGVEIEMAFTRLERRTL